MASHDHKRPLYVDNHEAGSILVAEFGNQAALLALPPDKQFHFLHGSVYLPLDAVAGRHKVYKVHGGPLGFMLSTNVAEADAQHAATLLRCARELLHVLGQVRLPCGRPLGVKMALSSGTITSGLLGSVSLTYQLVGRCVTVAHQLCKAQPELPLVATRSFCDTLPPAAAAKLLPVGRIELPCCPGELVEVCTVGVYRTPLPIDSAAQPAREVPTAASVGVAIGAPRTPHAASHATLQSGVGFNSATAPALLASGSDASASSSVAGGSSATSSRDLDAAPPAGNDAEPPALLELERAAERLTLV